MFMENVTLEQNIAIWKHINAEIISADIQRVGLKYRVIVRYRYIDGTEQRFDEYASRELPNEGTARAYAKYALMLCCP
jgi:hypothetical protein